MLIVTIAIGLLLGIFLVRTIGMAAFDARTSVAEGKPRQGKFGMAFALAIAVGCMYSVIGAESKFVEHAISTRGIRGCPLSETAFSEVIASEFSCVADVVADGAGSILEVGNSTMRMFVFGMTL